MPTSPARHRILRGSLVSDGGRVPDAAVVVDGDTVAWSGPARQLPEQFPEQLLRTAESVPLRASGELVIAPGLVDQHHHGCFGMDFGSSDEHTIREALPALYATGTTSVVASLVTAPLPRLIERIELLAGLVREGLLAGIHLEGPFLAAGRCGAHDPALLLHPADVEPTALLTAGGGTLRSITYAPELRGGAELARVALENGLVPSVGHTQARFETTSAALRETSERLRDAGEHLPAGAPPGSPSGRRPTVTHLFNAMDPLHHRSPGTIAASLRAAARSEAVVELIADGTHMADETAASVFDLVGAGNIALVTDSMAAAGLSDGKYRLGSLDVVVAEGVARLGPGPESDPDEKPSIAGGTATLFEVVRRMVAAGVGLDAALDSASGVPARALDLPSGRAATPARIGSLQAGAAADLLVLDEQADGRVELLEVTRAGVSV